MLSEALTGYFGDYGKKCPYNETKYDMMENRLCTGIYNITKSSQLENLSLIFFNFNFIVGLVDAL